MGSFKGKMQQVKEKLQGVRENKEENRHTKNIASHTSISQQKSSRDSYIIQIGFDFGTSYSKCVLRDLTTNQAIVYTLHETTSQDSFLISSVVIYQNETFSLNQDREVYYPENGLYHLKVALEKSARNIMDAPVLAQYQKVCGPEEKVQNFIEICTVFYLAAIFKQIKKDIKSHFFQGFGENPRDDMYINMAIPVASSDDSTVSNVFEKVLHMAWNASENDTFKPQMSLSAMKELVAQITDTYAQIKEEQKDICHIYPEVSANIQPLIRSSAATPDNTTIFFFSDTGAGTVDQCAFTNTGKLNYFAAQVLDCGSGYIERECIKMAKSGTFEDWRKQKESRLNDSILLKAIDIVGGKLKIGTAKTTKELEEHLYRGIGVDKRETIETHLRVIFGGGGHMDTPYKDSVVSGIASRVRISPEKIEVINISKLKDLNLKEKQRSWEKRLYVAYGLAFDYTDLKSAAFPSETKIDAPQSNIKQSVTCSCRGINKSCVRCGGTGFCS